MNNTPPPAVGPNPHSTGFTVNTLGEVWILYRGGAYALFSPAGENFALDIAVAQTGRMWVVTVKSAQNGTGLAWYNNINQTWVPVETTIPDPTNISATADGHAIVIDIEGKVWIVDQTGKHAQISISGFAGDFAKDVCMAGNYIWVVAGDANQQGAPLSRAKFDYSAPFANVQWRTVNHTLQALQVGGGWDDNGAYVVTNRNEIVHVTETGVTHIMPSTSYGSARDIAVGAVGTPWIITNEGRAGGDVPAFFLRGTVDEWYKLPAPAAAMRIAAC